MAVSRTDNDKVIGFGYSISHDFFKNNHKNGDKNKSRENNESNKKFDVNSIQVSYGSGKHKLDIDFPGLIDKETWDKAWGNGIDGIIQNIAENINTSISQLPFLLSSLSYMFGILLGVLGVMKIKDHVENPGQTPIKDGAIRLAAGGALLALPIIFESMLETVGSDGAGASVAEVTEIEWGG